MVHEGHIVRYFEFFRERMRAIGAVEDRTFRKLLAVSVLDHLGRVFGASEGRSPNVHDRFVNVVERFGAWREGSNVSLPQVSYRIDASPGSASRGFQDAVSERLGMWQAGAVVRLDTDPAPAELAPFALTPFDRNALKESTHLELLYGYRNYLVHETREPGYGLEFPSAHDEGPSYVGIRHIDEGRESWELTYPAGFFLRLLANVLEGLEADFRVRDVNPYTLSDFGSVWAGRQLARGHRNSVS